MADSDPNYTTVDKFNDDVKKWTVSTRRKIRSNIKSSIKDDSKEWKGRKTKKLAQSLTYGFRKNHGEVYRIRYSFERHGVFLHYGVGRGYVRNGDTVTRGVRAGKKDFIVKNGSINRKPVDWFDVEIKSGISVLADIAQEYHGDKALQGFAEVNKNALIDKR